ncbi:MAG: sigma 54-interacting transcriptional regulator [Polyangiaceae bacterium]|nr:sigma 54-interacting transcriptional regulator [Polyangiaceae bacterium]
MNTTQEKPAILRGGPQKRLTLRLVYTGEQVLNPPSVFRVGRGKVAIGREAVDGIALPLDPRASRLHATLHPGVTGTLRVVDESSRNGTFVQGRRVSQAPLSDGDVLTIGDSLLVVRAEVGDVVDGSVPELVGSAPAMAQLRADIHAVAPLSDPVLIQAETGCGKEVVAQAIHAASKLKGPFIPVNCSAIPHSLAESHLFGHVAGAFTGATAMPGLFRAAEGGTLFLDELGELPPLVQPKLLRVLQDRQVLSVGSTRPVFVNVRIVAATNRDLNAAIEAREFRADLYARIAQHTLTIVPLRERREDILTLFMLMLQNALEKKRMKQPPKISAPLAEALILHSYPFNVREVQSLAAQAALRGGDILDLPVLEDRLKARVHKVTVDPPSVDAQDDSERAPPPGREQLEELLRVHRGVIADVARAMGRSRKQVYRWITDNGLDVTRYRPPE